MMTEATYLGIDVGSTTVKAGVYDLRGRLLSQASRPNRVIRPRPGWSEQSMEEVWQATRACIRTAVAGVDAGSIVAVGVCGQGDGLWMLDADLQPVRNAILWNDNRGDDLVLGWIDDGAAEQLSRFCRTSNWAGSAGTAFRWLKTAEPHNAARVAHLLFCKDWIDFRLTGNLATDYADATIPFYDLESRTYADAAFDLLDVGELRGRVVPPQPGTRIHGGLRPDVAADLGLPAGLPVATGTIDLAAQMTGMGLQKVGDIGLVLGTTAVCSILIEPEPYAGLPVGATIAHPFLDQWIRVIAPLTGAVAIDWFASLHAGSLGDGDPADRTARLNDLVRDVPAGAEGVVFLPFLAGERAPFVAPQATASFHGLTAATTTAHMARAVMEGTAYSLRHCFLSTDLATPGQAFLTGGGARNPLWCDIIAAVLGTTIVASDASDHGLWGAAMIGAAAAGRLDLATAPLRAETTRVHVPDPAAVRTYDRLFRLYDGIVAASRPIWDAQRRAAAP